MTLHLNEIAQAVAPGAHALVLVDQAGWHQSKKLVVPANITLMPLPAKAPELNPVENIWQFMRENWISNRIFASYRDILDHCCAAWNKLTDQPWLIMSIGLRDWAYRQLPRGFGRRGWREAERSAGAPPLRGALEADSLPSWDAPISNA
jgi:transposase